MKINAIISKGIVAVVLFWAFGSGVMFAQSPPATTNKNQWLGDYFTRDILLSKDLEIFSMRAVQKLHDMADYLELVGSGKYDSELREEVGIRTVELFREADQRVLTLLPDCGPYRMGPVGSYIEDLMVQIGDGEMSVDVQEVEVVGQAKKDGKDSYRGVLSFRLMVAFSRDNVNQCNYQDSWKMDYWLVREPKDFGKVQKVVWVVKLGGFLEN